VIIERVPEPLWLAQHYYYGETTVSDTVVVDGKTVIDP
jgi:hypothetical protein